MRQDEDPPAAHFTEEALNDHEEQGLTLTGASSRWYPQPLLCPHSPLAGPVLSFSQATREEPGERLGRFLPAGVIRVLF